MTCRTCGADLPPRSGMGRQSPYCEAHRPARAAEYRRWQLAHAEHIRDYQRARFGWRSRGDRTCPCPCRLGLLCGEPFRGYLERCPRCRRPAHASRYILQGAPA